VWIVLTEGGGKRIGCQQNGKDKNKARQTSPFHLKVKIILNI